MTSPRVEPLLHILSCCRAVPGDTRSDADLLARFTGQGDQEAFAALVQRHGPMVLAICRRLLHDSHEASDAFQATFLVFVRKCPDLRRPEQLGPWLHGVAYRTASRLRQQSARRAAVPEDLGAIPGRSDEPLDRLAWQEVRAVLDEEVQRLPGKYRLPVVLCYLQGRSYAEAAKSLGWPVGTVSVRLARARERLRQRLARRGVGLSACLLGGLLAREAKATPVPAGLLATTLHGAAAGGAFPAGFSRAVLTLTEGVLRTMWLQKLKTTLLTGLLVAALCATGLGGFAWHHQGQAAAQDAPPAKEAEEVPPPKDDARSLDEQERKLWLQLKELRDRRARLQQRQASAILDEIEASLKKLRQTTARNPRNRQAVAEFSRAFARLKEELREQPAAPKTPLGGGGGPLPRAGRDPGLVVPGIIQDGRVLQVDAETKTALLSVGSKDGVKKGDVYRAYQSGKISPDQTGMLRVTDVHAKWSIATIIQNLGPRAPLQAQDILQRHIVGKKHREAQP